MAIIVKDEPDVHVTASELARYRDQYQRAFSMYAGTPPTFAEYIRREQERAKKPNRGYSFNG